jgi:hypothetical protein
VRVAGSNPVVGSKPQVERIFTSRLDTRKRRIGLVTLTLCWATTTEEPMLASYER